MAASTSRTALGPSGFFEAFFARSSSARTLPPPTRARSRCRAPAAAGAGARRSAPGSSRTRASRPSGPGSRSPRRRPPSSRRGAASARTSGTPRARTARRAPCPRRSARRRRPRRRGARGTAPTTAARTPPAPRRRAAARARHAVVVREPPPRQGVLGAVVRAHRGAARRPLDEARELVLVHALRARAHRRPPRRPPAHHLRVQAREHAGAAGGRIGGGVERLPQLLGVAVASARERAFHSPPSRRSSSTQSSVPASDRGRSPLAGGAVFRAFRVGRDAPGRRGASRHIARLSAGRGLPFGAMGGTRHPPQLRTSS